MPKTRLDLMIEGKTSMLYWFPKVRDLEIPQPKTEIVELDERSEFDDVLDGDFSKLGKYWDEIKEKSERIGFPLFLRTDLCSGKHEYENTCYVKKPEDLKNHIYHVIEWNGMPIIPLPYKALVFRQFIELGSRFKAFTGLPIAKERRYFINNGKIMCKHPYWPIEAITRPDNENWEQLLVELNKEDNDEVLLLKQYALKVANVLDDYWSVDFAQGKDGEWYLIDMAVGYESFHYPNCDKKLDLE